MLRSYVPGYDPLDALSVELEGQVTVEDLAAAISLPLEGIKIVMQNGRRVSLSALVTDGDEVAFFPAIGGG
jgi:molybdopterin converting factor small subunit